MTQKNFLQTHANLLFPFDLNQMAGSFLNTIAITAMCCITLLAGLSGCSAVSTDITSNQQAAPILHKTDAPVMPAADSEPPKNPGNHCVGNDPSSYIRYNQTWVEGNHSTDFDVTDVDAMFWRVFSGLSDEIMIYPSENYYYFILYQNGREFWGNIRLPAGKREKGLLSFGYFEFDEFPQLRKRKRGFSQSKFFSEADGLVMNELDRFTWDVHYRGKTVKFRLFQLDQRPPVSFKLGADELFIERTFDESGLQFFLLFNKKRNYFFWVLNEEAGAPEVFTPDTKHADLLLGRRSGFAFWKDKDHDNRKVLVAIRRLSSNRNDYYDGPFDQLADNYAEETKVAEYMQLAAPALRGRIDKFGYYLDKERPMRVALSCYYSYISKSDLYTFFEKSKVAEDPYEYISRRGIPKLTAAQAAAAKRKAYQTKARAKRSSYKAPKAVQQNPKKGG